MSRLDFWVGLLHTGLYGDTYFGFFLPVGQLCLGQIFDPLPHHPKIHYRDYIEGIPLNAKMSGALQTCDGISRVYSHCTSPESIVQTWYSMKTSPCVPDIGQPGTCLHTEIPVPPWESVPGFSCAASKWSRLIQTTLRCVTWCTWCDYPRQSCISRLTVHRWHWSWWVGVPYSCHGCILLILPYIGVDGKQIVPM